MLQVSPVGPVSGSKSHRRWPDARARELGRVDAPLNSLTEKDLCPGSATLEKINASLR